MTANGDYIYAIHSKLCADFRAELAENLTCFDDVTEDIGGNIEAFKKLFVPCAFRGIEHLRGGSYGVFALLHACEEIVEKVGNEDEFVGDLNVICILGDIV